MNKPRVAFIGRCDFGGLGVESLEFYEHMKPKTMLIITGSLKYNTQRFPDAFSIVHDEPSETQIADLLSNVDVLFTIETPYNWKAFRIARELNVKSILRINYEWLPEHIESKPDLFLTPTLWNFDNIPQPKMYLPFPVNTEKLKFKQRKKADVFFHLAGNMKAAYDRNGTEIFLKAIPLVKSDVKFIIHSQVYHPLLEIHDKRVSVHIDDSPDYVRNWDVDADVFVMPRRYAGQSLPLNEAMAKGMAIIATNMSPQNGFLAEELLLQPTCFRRLQIKRQIQIADIEPQTIADKIDEIAHKDISQFSRRSGIIADEWSWGTLQKKYEKLFLDICSRQ